MVLGERESEREGGREGVVWDRRDWVERLIERKREMSPDLKLTERWRKQENESKRKRESLRVNKEEGRDGCKTHRKSD